MTPKAHRDTKIVGKPPLPLLQVTIGFLISELYTCFFVSMESMTEDPFQAPLPSEGMVGMHNPKSKLCLD